MSNQPYTERYYDGAWIDIQAPEMVNDGVIRNYWIARDGETAKGKLCLNEFPAKSPESALRFALFMHKQKANDLRTLYAKHESFSAYKKHIDSVAVTKGLPTAHINDVYSRWMIAGKKNKRRYEALTEELDLIKIEQFKIVSVDDIISGIDPTKAMSYDYHIRVHTESYTKHKARSATQSTRLEARREGADNV
jgi:hypothetical protein